MHGTLSNYTSPQCTKLVARNLGILNACLKKLAVQVSQLVTTTAVPTPKSAQTLCS